MQRPVEKLIVQQPLFPAIVKQPVRRSGALYGFSYSTVQEPVDMAIKAGIGAVLGYALFNRPILGAGLGLATAVYNNYRLQKASAADAGVAGCCC